MNAWLLATIVESELVLNVPQPKIINEMKNEELIFGLGLNLPFDTYKDNVEWKRRGSYLTYHYSITKSPALYLILRFSV